MSRPSLCNLEWRRLRRSKLRVGVSVLVAAACVAIFAGRRASASNNPEAPAWLHGLVSVPLPEHDEKTDAVLLYSEENVNVQSVDRIHKQIRVAYKILRPGGRDLGNLVVPYRSDSKVLSMRAWSIPAQGKDFEVRDKDAADVAIPAVPGSELISGGCRKRDWLGIRARRTAARVAGRVVFPEGISDARGSLFAAIACGLGIQ